MTVSRVDGCESYFFCLLFLFISVLSRGGWGGEGGDVLKKQCSSLNKQPSPKYLISCIFNEPILKTCGLILGTPRPQRRAIFRLPPSTVSGTAHVRKRRNVNRRLQITRRNVRDDRAAAAASASFSVCSCLHIVTMISVRRRGEALAFCLSASERLASSAPVRRGRYQTMIWGKRCCRRCYL